MSEEPEFDVGSLARLTRPYPCAAKCQLFRCTCDRVAGGGYQELRFGPPADVASANVVAGGS